MDLLEKFDGEYGAIHVMRSKTDGTLAYYQQGSFHSQSNSKGISVCAYVHVMNEVLRQMHTRNVLILGCAGGTLATMLRQQKCKVTVVDINPLAFTIARRYFQMPSDVRCIRRCGIAYLRLTKTRYDAVVVDVFGGKNTVPRPFTTTSFFKRVLSVLSPSGVMVMNVITKNDKDRRARNIARSAQSTGIEMSVFDWPHHRNRNTILVGGATHNVNIPSGKEPHWMANDFIGIERCTLPKQRKKHNIYET